MVWEASVPYEPYTLHTHSRAFYKQSYDGSFGTCVGVWRSSSTITKEDATSVSSLLAAGVGVSDRTGSASTSTATMVRAAQY